MKVAELDPEATVTEDGTESDELLSERATDCPPLGAAALKLTVQVALPGGVHEEGLQVRFVTVGGATCSVTEKVRELLLALAVTTAVAVELTAALALAVKVAELDPEATVTEDGTESDELLSERATDCPPLGAAALKLTVQVALPGGVHEEGLQVRFVTVGGATCSVTEKVRELLLALAVTTAVAVELTAALALAVKVAELDPEATVTEDGTESDELLSERATACPPLGAAALKLTVQVALPGGVHDEGLQVRFVTVGRATCSVTEKVRELLLALAVTTAVAVELTAALALAVKVAELDPEATVTEDGTESDELLSERATACPPLGAAALKLTVQVALPGGVHDEGLQVRFVTVGRATCSVTEKVREVLLALAVTTAVAVELTAALALAVKVAVLDPEATVTDEGTESDELLSERVTACPPLGAAALKLTVHVALPGGVHEEGLHVRFVTVGRAACSVTEKVRELLLALAVTTAVACELTAALALAVKVAELDPDETVTDDGTESDELLSERVTACPPLGAAALKLTVQVALPGGVHEEGLQVRFVTVGRAACSVTEKVRELLLALAVTTAVACELTAALALAVKVAELDPDETVTDDGTESDELLSESATACPPLGAAALKLTVQVALPGGVHEEGLQVRFVTVGSTGWGCEMVTVPVLPDEGIDPPAAVTAEVLVICNCADVAEVPGAMVALTAATTPLEMVVVLNPVARQTIVPDPPEHVTDFPAAEAAEPVVTFTAEIADVG